MNTFDFYAVQVTGTKTALKKAGVHPDRIRTERIGWRVYGRKRFPEYRTYASVAHFDVNDRESLEQCEREWASKGLRVSTKYFARD